MTTKCRFVNAAFDLTYLSGAPLFQGDLRLIGFNVNMGIGDGSSILDLDIAIDTCIGAGGGTVPGVGLAAFFRSRTTDFEFNGIINSATYTDGPNGRIFKYKIVDPKKLLDNVYVLLKDYYCNLGLESLPNFINFAYYHEGITSAVCPPGQDTENWPRVGGCGGYGTSGIFGSSSQNGVSISKVLDRISSSVITILTTDGDRLYLDLSRLAARVRSFAPWSKTDSTGMSLGALVAQAAEDSACDYIVTLERGGFVVVWPIDRTTVIAGNPISAIIAAYKQSGTLLNSEEGSAELYEPSNKVIFGDKVSYISEVDCRNGKASMMMGYDPNGNPIRAKGTNFTVSINTSSLSAIVDGFPAMTKISEREILCAKTQEMWTLYGQAIDTNSLSGQLLKRLGLDEDLKDADYVTAFRELTNAKDADGTKGWKEKFEKLKTVNQYIAKRRNFIRYVECWKWFNQFIGEYYGRKWLVPIKNFCIYPPNFPPVLIGDGGPYQISDVPTDSGYPSSNQFNRGILQLNGDNALLFEAADGKYNGFIKVDTTKAFRRKINKEDVTFTVSLEEISPGSFVVQGRDVYVKTTLEGEIHGNNGAPEVLISTNMVPMSPKLEGEDENDFVNKGLIAMAALFGVDKFKKKANRDGYMNISQMNIFQLNPLAADLDFAAVPMKSNMYVYGPWVATKGPTGSTEVVVDTQLSPWNYGSISQMNLAGQNLANMGIRLSNKEFTGSFRVAEPPALSVRDFVLNYSLLVSSINVIYGSGGVTTDVAFKTFVPKFGNAGKALSDLMLENNKARSQTLGYFKEIRRKAMNEVYTLYTNIQKEILKIPQQNAVKDGSTPYFILIGGHRGNEENESGSSGGSSLTPAVMKSRLDCKEICKPPKTQKPSESSNGGSSKPKIVNVELEKGNIADLSFSDTEYKYRSIMSIDGLFAPVSIKGRDNYISRYFTSYDSSLKIAKPRPPMPPFGEIFTINQKYLNPIVSKKILGEWDGRGVSKDGFYINFIGFGDSIDKIKNTEDRQDSSDFGFFALKGPLVLQAWGYDTEGKPIPNIVDSPADTEKGIFKNGGTKNKFMTNWLENQKTWPVGPIDLRFDRARGVWVCPQQERIVVAQLTQDLLPNGSAQAILLNPQASGGLFYENYGIYGPNGENYGSDISSIKITVHDFLTRKLCKGTRVYAYYNDTKYIVLDSSATDETECECDCSTESETEDCPDVCGLKDCLSQLGVGPGVLGLDEDGCLTLYPLVDCGEPSPTPSP